MEAPFSYPVAALVLVSTKNRELWEGPTPEVRDSRTSGHFPHARRQVNSEHARKTGPSLRSRYLVVTKRSAASGDANLKTRLACENSRPSSLPARVKRHSGPERRRAAVFAG